MQNSLSLGDSLFLGRQIKVVPKRTNRPGISTTNRPPRGAGSRGRARVIIKYIYPGMRGRGRPPRFECYTIKEFKREIRKYFILKNLIESCKIKSIS